MGDRTLTLHPFPPRSQPLLYYLYYPVGAHVLLGGYYPFPIRNTLVPQVEHVPWVAGLPFLSVICTGLLISRFVSHFMQYASIDTSSGLNWA